MTKNSQLEGLTTHTLSLLDEIYRRGGWITRSELADAWGKKKLNPWDTGMLDKLVERGLIEKQQRPRPGAVGFEWIYRAKPE